MRDATSELASYITGAVAIRRAVSGVTPVRLPIRILDQHSDEGIAWMAGHAAGVRLRMQTAASVLEIHARVTRNRGRFEESSRSAYFVATVGSDRDRVEVARAAVDDGDLVIEGDDGTYTVVAGRSSVIRLEIGAGASDRIVDVWLPHNARVEVSALRADAVAYPARRADGPRWTHHGSSISHCLEADDPLGPWPQEAARVLGAELTNLGFAGNAMLDPFVARTIGSIPADVISIKLGVNIVNGAAMTERTFAPAVHGFLDLIRDAQPSVPIIVMTAIACPGHEALPGPTRRDDRGLFAGFPRMRTPGDGLLSLARTRDLVGAVVKERRVSDPNLYLVDGLDLLGHDDTALLYDGLHPDQDGYDLMASRFVDRVRSEPSVAAAFGSAVAR